MSDPARVGRLVWWAVVVLVVSITGRTVYWEQQGALETCAPECRLLAVAGAGADVVLSATLAVPTFSAFGLPIGIGLSLLFLLWLLQFVQTGPRV